MWKGESLEVRARYLQKSLEIKAHLLALHPNYKYSPRKSSQIRRRARRAAQSPSRPASPSQAQPFQHNAHLSPQANNMKAGLKSTSQITRVIPGAQQFLPPVVAPGWTPYHLLPGASSPAAPASVEEDIVEDGEDDEDLVEEAPAQQALDGMNIDAGHDFESVDEFMENWDIEADLTWILASV